MDFPYFVDTKNIKILLDEENDFRYFLSIPLIYDIAVPPKKVLAILKNPSKAKIDIRNNLYESDHTVNRVISYFFDQKFTEVVIVNLFTKYFTESNRLNDYVHKPIKIIGKDNDAYIKKFIQSNDFERIVVGWGGFPKGSGNEMKNLYRERISKIEEICKGKKVYYVERMVEGGLFPKHGMVWTIGAAMFEYKPIFNALIG